MTASDPYFVGLPRRRHLGLRVERAEDGTLVAQCFRSRDRDAEEWIFVGSVAIGRGRQSPWRARTAPWLMPIALVADVVLLPAYLFHNHVAHHRLISKDTAML